MPALDDILTDYRQLLESVDAWFAGCLAAAPPGRIACGPGCSACCRGLFDITLLDAYLLQQAFAHLPGSRQAPALAAARTRRTELQQQWPGFAAPYLLNGLPDAEWTEMPEDDQNPCPLLGADGRCLVYDSRPMTCRLHGLPNIDVSGESFADTCCTLNYVGSDPLADPALRWTFRAAFEREIALFHAFTRELTGRPWTELDTFIPNALLIDFAAVDWQALQLSDPRYLPPGPTAVS